MRSLKIKRGRVIIVVIMLIFLMIYIDFRIQASLLEFAKSRAQIRGVELINQIVNEKIVAKVEYKDIVIIHKDDKGHVVLIQPNTIMLNKIMTDTVIEITASMRTMQQETMSIPLGQLTGSKILAALGPRLNVRVIPTGQINVGILNKFEQAGINQTRHLLYFQINTKLRITVPFIADEIDVSTTMPLAETIIVGDVPQTYVDFKGEGESLYPFIKK